uniref:Uncharacterized protein n=1 Tax=Bactrocera dorsalis TaxID=27457 RepID=A0A034W8Q4_BACDO
MTTHMHSHTHIYTYIQGKIKRLNYHHTNRTRNHQTSQILNQSSSVLFKNTQQPQTTMFSFLSSFLPTKSKANKSSVMKQQSQFTKTDKNTNQSHTHTTKQTKMVIKQQQQQQNKINQTHNIQQITEQPNNNNRQTAHH